MNILITGGHGEIGNAIAQNLLDYNVYCPTRQEMDLSNIKSIEQWVYNNNLIWDALIYVAGINIIQPIKDLDLTILQQTLQINTLSFISLSKLLNFNKNSSIIAIGSIYSRTSREGRIAYSTSKHGLLGAVKTLALEFAKDNITVNCISPGFVYTKLTIKNNTQNDLDKILKNTPLQKFVDMQDINNLCRFLLEQHSMTGQNLIIDAGYTI